MARYSWRVPKAVSYGQPGYNGNVSNGPYRVEVGTHLGSFGVTQDTTWHTTD